MTDINGFGLIFCIVAPLLAVPFFVGISLINRSEDFVRFAGWMTLKPVLGTALLILGFALAGSSRSAGIWLSIFYFLMAIGLTILIIRPFRQLLSQPQAENVWILIVLDVLRWGILPVSSLLTNGGDEFARELRDIFSFLGIAMPTIFAVIALLLSRKQSPSI